MDRRTSSANLTIMKTSTPAQRKRAWAGPASRPWGKLRGPRQQLTGQTIDANRWMRERGIHSGPLEMLVEFETNSGAKHGVRLYKGPREETVVSVDTQRVWIDRTKSGNVTFHPKFSSVQFAPLKSQEPRVKLHIFMDACLVEVFVNDGEQVLTTLTFPSPDSRGIGFFGENQGANIRTLELWPITSSWK
jgi:fructan beta-fructosidase